MNINNNNEVKDILKQINEFTEQGIFGEKAKEKAEKYKNIPMGVPTCLEFVKGFYNSIQNEESHVIIDKICQYIVIIHRDTKYKSPDIAKSLAESLIKDYPNTKGTNLINKLNALMNASMSYKRIINSKDYIIIWENSKNLILAYNEFLNGLIGWLCICIRALLGKKVKQNILNNSYGNKVREFKENTMGLFFEINNIAKVNLRNAIGHGTIWNEKEKNLVKYRDKENEYEMSIFEFGALAYIGSWLAQAYLAALSIIIISEYGSKDDILKLPEIYHTIFNINVN